MLLLLLLVCIVGVKTPLLVLPNVFVLLQMPV
jgi:hypothetical protein